MDNGDEKYVNSSNEAFYCYSKKTLHVKNPTQEENQVAFYKVWEM